MQNLYEKVAYLKGLSEGLGINNTKKEGKLLSAVIDVLNDIVEAIDNLNKNQEDDNFLDPKDFDFLYECPNCNEKVELKDIDNNESDNVICQKCNEVIAIVSNEVI